ncbi:MAG TPA: hypothetical protein VIV59_03595 [Anaeromyxobacteraceae bacterium]
MTEHPPKLARRRPFRRAGAAAALLAAALALGVAPASAEGGAATIVLAARSIGSKRGEPPNRRSHAALLVRFDGRPGGFIVQGGKEPASGSLFGGSRVVGWAIPAQDPSQEFTRAVGGWWGEPGVRELPTQEIARFTMKGLTEARLRALVDSLNQEFQGRDYRLEGGPSSNSFVSRLLDRLKIDLPPLGDVQLPGWGWRP